MSLDELKQTPEGVAALHESFHFVGAVEFGINALPTIFDESQQHPQANGRLPLGQCAMDPSTRLSPFRAAVVGWLGVVGEALVGIEHTLPDMPWPLNKTTARSWWSAAMTRFEELSLGDQHSIWSYRRSTWATFKCAYRIARKRKRLALRLAHYMILRKEKDMLIRQHLTQPKPDPWQRFAARAAALAAYIECRPVDDPDLPKLNIILQHLRSMQEPPGDLFPPQ